MQVSILRTVACSAINSSHFKVTKINQNIGKVTIWNSHLPIINKENKTTTVWQHNDHGPSQFLHQWHMKMFGTDCPRYTNSHSDTSTVGGNIRFITLCSSKLPCILCWECVAYLKDQMSIVASQTSGPQLPFMQSADNKPSTSQFEKRMCTSLFSSKGEEQQTQPASQPAKTEVSTQVLPIHD